jgi:hypothetical protein
MFDSILQDAGKGLGFGDPFLDLGGRGCQAVKLLAFVHLLHLLGKVFCMALGQCRDRLFLGGFG